MTDYWVFQFCSCCTCYMSVWYTMFLFWCSEDSVPSARFRRVNYKIKSTIYTCINLNLALYYIYVYSNNVVQKLPCHMAIIQNSGSKRTSVCTHMNKKINLCTCPLYIISSYPLFCCHCQSLQRSWAFFCDCSLVIPIAEEEG